jgi:hypothetical protein
LEYEEQGKPTVTILTPMEIARKEGLDYISRDGVTKRKTFVFDPTELYRTGVFDYRPSSPTTSFQEIPDPVSLPSEEMFCPPSPVCD